MAEGGVRTLEHVWLVQTPSRDSQIWRDALASACEARGWAFVVHERGQPAPTPDAERPQLTVSWLDWREDQPVTHLCVQHGSPQGAPEVLVQWDRIPESEALYEASLRFAHVEQLAQNGVMVVGMDQDRILLPGLGEVDHPSAAEPRTPNADDPLDLYRQTPQKPQTSSTWGPELFSYADADAAAARTGKISLIGRRRMLFNGPPIFLPPGRWRFEAEFSIDPPTQTELLIEWGYGYDTQSLPVVIDHAGRYSVSLEQVWTHPACGDFRIHLMIPALDGRLEFHGGVVTRIGDAPTPQIVETTPEAKTA